jgi:hypothetical protein
MAPTQAPPDHLSGYERAVCYYTLPKVISPVTYGIIAAYTVFLLQTLVLFIVALIAQSQTWTFIGGAALAAAITGGLLVFTLQALLNEVRRAKALAAASAAPGMESEADEFPDPFAGYLLFQYPLDRPEIIYLCENDKKSIVYRAEEPAPPCLKRAYTPDGDEYLCLKALGGIRSFSFGRGLPARISVLEQGRETARITRRISFGPPAAQIQCHLPEPREYTARQGGLYYQGRLVGRIYSLRRHIYLDIDGEHFNAGIFAHYLTKNWSTQGLNR